MGARIDFPAGLQLLQLLTWCHPKGAERPFSGLHGPLDWKEMSSSRTDPTWKTGDPFAEATLGELPAGSCGLNVEPAKNRPNN